MMLMLVATLPAEDEEYPSTVLSLRFFDSDDGPAHVKKLAWGTIRKRYGKALLEQCGRGGRNIIWDVYEPRTSRGGWPHWLGPSVYYE